MNRRNFLSTAALATAPFDLTRSSAFALRVTDLIDALLDDLEALIP